jgi:nicotinate dehydrogenase subunit A
MRIQLLVNGRSATVDLDPNTLLLYVLRNDLRLDGPKFGCGLAQCGACTVLADGKPIHSCVTPVSAARNKEILTLEGLGTLTAKALLDKNPNPTYEQIRQALAGVLCRCGTHLEIIRAVNRAAQQRAKV